MLTNIYLKFINLLSFTDQVYAQVFTHDEAKDFGKAAAKIGGGIQNLVGALRQTVLALGVLFVIVGFITIATSAGDPEKLTKGKQTVFWSLAAIFLALTIWTFVRFILGDALGVQGLGETIELNFELPNL